MGGNVKMSTNASTTHTHECALTDAHETHEIHPFFLLPSHLSSKWKDTVKCCKLFTTGKSK